MPRPRSKQEILEVLRWKKKNGASSQVVGEHFNCSKNSVLLWEKLWNIPQLEKMCGYENKQTIYAPSEEVKKAIDDAAVGMMEVTKKAAHIMNLYLDSIIDKFNDHVNVKLPDITMVRNILQVAAPFALATKGNGSEKEVPVDKQSQFSKIEAQARLAIQEANKQVKTKGNAKRAS
jgi:hypothetical protein